MLDRSAKKPMLLDLPPGCTMRRRRRQKAPTLLNLKGKVLAHRGWEIGFDGQLFSLLSHRRRRNLLTSNKRPSIRERGLLRSRSLIKWTENRPMKAECLLRTDAFHDSPSVNCNCGLYAVKEPANCFGSVTGRIEIWGHYVEHDKGWRAEYAYPVALSDCKCEPCGKTISFSMAKVQLRQSVDLEPLTVACRDCLKSLHDICKWVPVSHVIEQIGFLYGLEVN